MLRVESGLDIRGDTLCLICRMNVWNILGLKRTSEAALGACDVSMYFRPECCTTVDVEVEKKSSHYL